MTIHRSTFRRFTLSTMFLALTLDAALAQGGAAIADRLKAAMAAQGLSIGWSAVTGDASSMVLKDVSIKPAAEQDGLEIGDVTLTGVTEKDGGYRIEKVETAPFSTSAEGMTLDLSPLVVTGVNIPAEGAADPLSSIMLYQSLELANLSVKVADRTAFTLEGLGAEITQPADGTPMQFTGAADRFSGDLSLVSDPQAKAVIDALGYQNVSGRIDMAGGWEPTGGRLALSQYDVIIDDAGTFGMTFDVGGYTTDFIKSMQELQKKMTAAPEGGDDSARNLAMLGLMQQLTVNGASLRFDDDSLTGKVLDYLAGQQGASASDIANQAKAVVPFMLAQLNNPDLAAEVTAAVGAFLDSPMSIEIALAPAAPVPFAQLMAGAMANPVDLTRTLGVKVTANQK